MIRNWYLGLTGRERVLVGVAGAFAGIVVLIYGIVLPIGAAHDAAHVRHAEAVIAAGEVEAGLARLDTLPEPPSGSGPVSPLVASLAQEKGIVLQSNQPSGNEGARIAIATAAPGAAFAFLDDLRRAGLGVEAVTISPSADGSVAVNASLRRSAP